MDIPIPESARASNRHATTTLPGEATDSGQVLQTTRRLERCPTKQVFPTLPSRQAGPKGPNPPCVVVCRVWELGLGLGGSDRIGGAVSLVENRWKNPQCARDAHGPRTYGSWSEPRKTTSPRPIWVSGANKVLSRIMRPAVGPAEPPHSRLDHQSAARSFGSRHSAVPSACAGGTLSTDPSRSLQLVSYS